jgi:hypothetical protein
MKAPNLRLRPPFVRGIPIVLEILDLKAENPMNLQNEKPPRFMRFLPGAMLIELGKTAP